jgi:glycosyltransferase involved in cell wall biosynthesis
MTKPFFSIILPVYNREKFISRAIKSVIDQTCKNWEMIIIDDGSTDNTRKIIEAFDDDRIKYFYQENKERSAARNNGISKSSGLYICFLDSDDYYLENHLQNLYDILSSRDHPVSFYFVLRAFESNNVISFPPLNDTGFRNNFEMIFNIMIATPQACIHREILEKHRFNPEFKTGEDLELWSRILLDFPLVKVNKHTIVSVIHEENSVNFSSGNFYLENLKVVRFIFRNKNISKYISSRQKHLSISNCYFGIARYYLFKKKNIHAIFNFIKSIYYFPFHRQNRYRFKLILNTIFNK